MEAKRHGFTRFIIPEDEGRKRRGTRRGKGKKIEEGERGGGGGGGGGGEGAMIEIIKCRTVKEALGFALEN